MFLVIPIIALIWVGYIAICAFTGFKEERAVGDYRPIFKATVIFLITAAVISTIIHRI